MISAISGAAAALNVGMLPMLGTIALIIAAVSAVIAIGVALYQNWDTIVAKCSEFSANVQAKFEEIRASIGDKVEAAKKKVSDVFESIRKTIKEKIDAAKEAVSGAIEKIKGFFNFSWSLPSLKMPHFSITGEFSLVPPRVPHVSVDWYAKAMETPILLNGATIFGAMNGNLLGGGEAGQEVILGLNKLKEMSGETNINIVINATPNQSEAEIARMVSRQIQNDIMRKKAVFG
jgi:low affinity Fe/Cu permease